MFRILFVAVAAFIILMVTVLIGLGLKAKLEDAENRINGTEDSSGGGLDRGDESTDGEITLSSTVFAGGINLSGFATEEECREAINALSITYSSALFPLTSDDGKLIYSSPALCDLLRLPYAEESNTAFALLKAALNQAYLKGISAGAVITPSNNVSSTVAAGLIDGTLIHELATLGMNEVMIRPQFAEESAFTSADASKLRSYLSECLAHADSSSLKVGVILPEEIYLNSGNAKLVQMVALSSAFLAIELDLDAYSDPAVCYESVTEKIQSLLGTFSVYNLRVVIDAPSAEIAAAAYKACRDNAISNISFTDSYSSDELQYTPSDDDDVTSNQPTAPADPQANKNPYAGTSFGSGGK